MAIFPVLHITAKNTEEPVIHSYYLFLVMEIRQAEEPHTEMIIKALDQVSLCNEPSEYKSFFTCIKVICFLCLT